MKCIIVIRGHCLMFVRRATCVVSNDSNVASLLLFVQDTFIPWQSPCGPYITPSRQFSTKRHHPLFSFIFGSNRVLFDRKEFENAEGRPTIVPLEGSSAGCWALFCIKTAFITSVGFLFYTSDGRFISYQIGCSK